MRGLVFSVGIHAAAVSGLALLPTLSSNALPEPTPVKTALVLPVSAVPPVHVDPPRGGPAAATPPGGGRTLRPPVISEPPVARAAAPCSSPGPRAG